MAATSNPRSPRIGVALAALAAAALLAAAPAQAADATSAVCTERMTATITPGFSTTRSSGTITTGGQTGSIICVGTLDGHRFTGAGSIGFEETYTGTCASDSSRGTVRVTIPTTAGTQHLVGTFVQRRTALAISVEVRFAGARYSAIGVVIPTRGNCLVSPLRQVAVVLTGALRSAP